MTARCCSATPAFWTRPPGIDSIRLSKMVTRTALHETAAADFSDAEVVREFAVSKDGTRIPLNIIRRKGTKLDGKNPVLLTGYGGYGVSITPDFSLRRKTLLDHGFVLRDREPARRRRIWRSLASRPAI